MNNANSTRIKISRRDFFKLPSEKRCVTGAGPMVMSVVRGREIFVSAEIIN
jgi:hypothetical protein